MAGNSFGTLFRITTFGESHGKGIGVVIDGCPPGIPIDVGVINRDLARRRPGQSRLTTQRKEDDQFEMLSGLLEGHTTGVPIALWIPNKDARSKDYDHLKTSFRPSHADYTYQAKYGIRDVRGSGRASARETAARVAAGGIARQVLGQAGISISAFVSAAGKVSMETDREDWTLEEIEASPVRCPDQDTSQQMESAIMEAKTSGDTIGGIITCVVSGCPAGLGEPVFDKLHADLGKAVLSINACKGFEIGSGFAGTRMRGSEHNDRFVKKDDTISTTTNYSGGVQGGISNGMNIVFRVAFKPVSTIMKPQTSLDQDGNEVVIEGKGRHDPCVVPRAVPIVEAMAALVITDHLLRQNAIMGARDNS